MTELQVAIYARVSSDQQTDTGTTESQLAQLRERLDSDGYESTEETEFIDEGYSGATLMRPALERLRDLVAAGVIDRVYVHSPDRLARNYAYQVILVDELRREGVDIVFLNRALSKSPEDDLLLQVQGMVAEYERAKILERSRRGKRYAARKGLSCVLSGAPFGYLYVTKVNGWGEARYEIVPEEGRVVQEIFDWIGRDRCTIGEVTRRLTERKEQTRTGKTWWDRTTVWGILKNPAYRGEAAFGKTRIGPRRKSLRPPRGKSDKPKRFTTTYDLPEDEWTYIPVPALVSKDLFEAVQEQLKENRTHARQRKRGARYLLQGLIQCKCCGYSYYGKGVSLKSAKGKRREYAYYRCIGTDAYRFGGERICSNKQVRTDFLDKEVWIQVKNLLNHPSSICDEYHHRLEAPKNTRMEDERGKLGEQIQKIRRGTGRLIDSYTEGWIEKTEFESRMGELKKKLTLLEAKKEEIEAEANLEAELRLIVGRLEEFSQKIGDGLEKLDWNDRRELIRTLVKRVEVTKDQVNVVFRVEGPGPLSPSSAGGTLPHCLRRALPLVK